MGQRKETSLVSIHETTAYHAYCIWLFTYSDLFIMLFPETAFGMLHALWYTETSQMTDLTSRDVFHRLPSALFWVWINLLSFNIGNQRHPEAIAEDALNKPWRTMPSGLWSTRLAGQALVVSYASALITSWYIGGLRPCIALVGFGYWYNDCGGGDVHGLVRNFINTMGFTSFGLGALEVALGHPLSFTFKTLTDFSEPSLEVWVLLLGIVVFSTVHTQDMHDQKGDAVRGRLTLPLQIGDAPARYIISGFMTIWGILCPYFWQCGLIGYLISTPIAHIVAYRSFFLRSVNDDKATFQIWNLWMVSLYALPLERLIS